jgi:hypothetical protein
MQPAAARRGYAIVGRLRLTSTIVFYSRGLTAVDAVSEKGFNDLIEDDIPPQRLMPAGVSRFVGSRLTFLPESTGGWH